MDKSLFKDRKSILKKGSTTINITMLIVAFLITAICIITGSYINDTEVVTIGAVAGKRYVSTRDVENVIQTQKLRDEAVASVGNLYKHDATIEENALLGVEEFFNTLNTTIVEIETEAIKEQKEILNGAGAGQEGEFLLTPTLEELMDFSKNLVLAIPVYVSSQQMKGYYNLSPKDRLAFKEDLVNSIKNAYGQRITDETLTMVLEEAETSVNNTSWNEEIRLLGNAVLIALLQPNLVLDEEAMEIARMQKSLEVEPIMILEGQKIIDEGEIVTQEVYSILNELGLVNKSYAGSLVPFLGSISLVFITFLAVFFYLKTQLKKVLSDPVNSILIFILYLMQMGILVLMADLSSYYFIPVTLFAMLTSILIRSKIAVSLNIVLSISALFIFNGSTDFLVYTLITGTFSALLVQYTNKRSRIILVATALAFIHFGTYVASELFFGKVFTPELFREGINAAAIGAGTVVVVVGSLPMWEAVFGINTPYRLMELANPTNELMRRLMIETPGTYHHCLIVANLAETAAYDIYCNGSLARVGAYYHDIGKLANPLYYSENQFGENIHDKLDPEISAKMIIAHIKEGVDLARKHNVPEVIVDIIKQHHGTTLVKYFYMKSAKEKIGVETLESNFRYEGPIPQFKEAAIVMLADTIEAAVRSVVSAGKSINDVEEIIDRLIKDKLNDGQLDDCRLDLKELAVIKKAFLKIFNGMYHDRIAYPKDEDIEKTRKENQQKKINKN